MSYLREDPEARQTPVLRVISLQAVRISRKPNLELACGPRIMNARCKIFHFRNLLRLSGEPRSQLCAAPDYVQLRQQPRDPGC